MRLKAVNLLVSDALPEDIRGELTGLDANGMGAVLAAVAKKYPDQYEDIADKLSRIGRDASYWQGETLTLKDVRPVLDRPGVLAQMDAEVDALRATTTDPDEFKKEREKIWERYSERFQKETMSEALRQGNNIGFSVASGARGKPAQLKAMLSTPALYAGPDGKTIPVFIRNGFNNGLRPHEYLAGTYGARSTVISTKVATAKGGYLGKLMAQAAAPVVVSEKDCGVDNGLDFDLDDPSLRGRVLARQVGDHPAGTVIDRALLADLRRKKVGGLIARSPLTCGSEAGVCARCAGADARGELPAVGDAVGITAVQALSEPIAQGALSSKHCLVEGTMVRMADGSTRPIELIRVGEWVLGADKTGKTFPVKVTHTWDQGPQATYRYVYRAGSTSQYIAVECTPEHEILQNKKQYDRQGQHSNNRKAAKMPAGIRVKNVGAVFPTESSWAGVCEPWALLLGVWLGDGHRWTNKDGQHSPVFSCADAELIEDLQPYLAQFGLIAKKSKRSHDWRVVHLEKEDFERNPDGTVAVGLRHPLKLKLLEWGLEGDYAHQKRLPSCVWSWDLESVTSLVAGYLATDGSIYRTKAGNVGVSFGSTSREMLEDFKELIAVRLCVYGGPVSRNGKVGEGNRKNDMWSFAISRVDQWSRLLTLVDTPGVKRARGAALVASPPPSLFHDPFYRLPRVEVIDTGVQPCHDITVDHPDELFVLENGLIVSNTAGQAEGKKEYAGFDVINRFVQTPDQFEDRAVVAETDGKVTRVEPAPQGGTYVYINDERHYVLPGYPVTVGVGDSIEAGEQLAEGLGDPGDVVRLRGLGEGRRYYSNRLADILNDSGMPASKRNTEMLARAALDHMLVDDADGLDGLLPDDVVSYSRVRRLYDPPEDTQEYEPAKAVGKFLQGDALHYTIGTRITPKVADHLQRVGWGPVRASAEAPSFRPQMIRLQSSTHNNPDWLASQHTSYLKKQLTEDASRGRTTNTDSNIHFAPRLAKGEDFGKNVRDTGKF
jgi:hypothetical protein